MKKDANHSPAFQSVIVNRAILLHHLKSLEKIIPRKAYLPAVENFYFRFGIHAVEVSVTDLDISIQSITSDFLVSTTIEKAKQEIELLVPPDLLIKTLAYLESEQVEFRVTTNPPVLTIKTENGSYQINCEAAGTYPVRPELETSQIESTFAIPAKDFLTALQLLSVVTFNDPLRPFFAAIHLRTEGNKLIAEASNMQAGIRLTYTDRSVEGNFESMITPRFAAVVAGLCPDDLLMIHISHQRLFILPDFRGIPESTTHTLMLSMQCIAGKFPDMDRVLVGKYQATYHIEIEPFLNALKRLAVFTSAGTAGYLAIQYTETEFLLTVPEVDNTSAKEKLPVFLFDSYGTEFGDTIYQIGINVDRMLVLLRSLTSKYAFIHFQNAATPLFISPAAADPHEPLKTDYNFLSVLVPMALNTY